MRKLYIFTAILTILFLCLIEQKSFASRLNQEDGILPNHSAEYVRTLNRNASTDADAAFYNPAGLAFLENNGLHVMFSCQTYYAQRIHSMDYYGIAFNGGPFIPTATKLNPAMGLPQQYDAETIAPCLPDLDIIWKDDVWAVFFDLSVMQAAPGMTFDKGLAIIDWGNMAQLETLYASIGDVPLGYWRDAKAVRTEMYIGGTVGGVYKIKDWVSTALAIRYIYASGNQNISVKYASAVIDSAPGDGTPDTVQNMTPWLIDVDVNGHGVGLIAGFHFRPVDILDIGFRYEYYLPMVLKKKTNKFLAPGNIVSSGNLNIFMDSWKWAAINKFFDAATNMNKMTPSTAKTAKTDVKPELKVTYPQSLSLGVSVKIIKNLRVEVSGELSLREYRDLDGREDAWNLGYKAGGCIEWTFLPKITFSAGYLYNDFGIRAPERNEVDPLLTSHSVGGGFTFDVTDRLDVTVGFLYMIFVPQEIYFTEYTNVSGPTMHALQKDFDEHRMSLAIGLSYRFFGGSSSKPNKEKMTIKLQ